MEGARIAVLGADGHTARFVRASLQQRGATVLPATRQGWYTEGSRQLGCASLDFGDPEALDRLFDSADAVINCAGPFLDTAIAGADAAVRRAIPYLDLAAEQQAVLDLIVHVGPRAEDRGVTLLPATAFFGGLGDLLATSAVGGLDEVDAIDIAVGLDSWRPTEGTRRTGARNTHQRLIVEHGRFVPLPTPARATTWAFPPPLGTQSMTLVPLTETVLIHRHLKCSSVRNYLNEKPLVELGDPATPPPDEIGRDGRSSQRFIVDAKVTSRSAERTVRAFGQDIYAISAPLVAAACSHVLEKPCRPGVTSVGELFEPTAFLSYLSGDMSVELVADLPSPADVRSR